MDPVFTVVLAQGDELVGRERVASLRAARSRAGVLRSAHCTEGWSVTVYEGERVVERRAYEGERWTAVAR